MLRQFSLPGGGLLEWREYGDPAGTPVFFFHGWPGESHQGALIHDEALEKKVRLICPNRPGIGGSSRQPGRDLLDWPPMVAALADHLGVDRFRILGLSGGGPYALACAWALGKSRVIACATVCGALPALPGPDRRRLSPVYQLMLHTHDRAPWLLQWALIPLTRVARIPPPRPLLWLALRTLGPRDREALQDRAAFQLYFPGFQNAMRSGMRGLWEDGHPYASAWPFDPAGITVPLVVWHGTQDKNFACAGAAKLAAGIPGAAYHEVEDGHYSILRNQARPILDTLLDLG
jgi:pimeloyl-ACP methyl ester carboxylesterase